jgi:hypothetical protein
MYTYVETAKQIHMWHEYDSLFNVCYYDSNAGNGLFSDHRIGSKIGVKSTHCRAAQKKCIVATNLSFFRVLNLTLLTRSLAQDITFLSSIDITGGVLPPSDFSFKFFGQKISRHDLLLLQFFFVFSLT